MIYLTRSKQIFWSDFIVLKNAILKFENKYKVILATALVFYIIPLLFLAVYVKPNNFDSHSYHLNRILYWINNQNLDHFPTQHIQQLYHNVFAEYLVLDTMLLSGSDRFANLIQFGAMLGSLCSISLLAQKMGLKANGQILSAIFLITLPIGIFESTTTQVDYIACFYFITYVYLGFELLDRKSITTLIYFILALAFGGFTKYTVFVFALPFTIYFAIRLLTQYGFLYGVKVFVLASILITFTFAPFFFRNYALFGNIMNPKETSRFFAEKIPADKHGVQFSMSNVLKNASLHMGLPSNQFNGIVGAQIEKAHKLIGVDVNDPELSIDSFSVRYSVQEDMMPNTFHFWLIVIASILLLFSKGSKEVKWILICSLLGFILFSSMMKFQLWSSRTHMPFFAMGAVVVAFACTTIKKINTSYIIYPLMAISIVYVYGNPNKPFLPLSYLTKKTIAHVPINVCPKTIQEEKIFKNVLDRFYNFSIQDDCYPLTKTFSYKERAEIFNKLDSIGYYKDDKSATIFGTNEVKNLFLSHLDNYDNFNPLLKHITGDHSNIGVLIKNENGFYHYWSAIDSQKENPGEMKYIRYKKEYTLLANSKKPFYYNYILGDNLHLLNKFLPHVEVDTIYTSNSMSLVKLKTPSCKLIIY